jgi:CBS domain
MGLADRFQATLIGVAGCAAWPPLDEIAILMEQNSIKRVPIVSKEQLVGIVSRANLIQTVASKNVGLEVRQEDAAIRDKLLIHLKAQSWVHTSLLNVTVNGGLVHLWGNDIFRNREKSNLRCR